MTKSLITAVPVAALLVFGLLQSKSDPSKKDAVAVTETAIFAGGCFWCVEANFEKTEGVSEVISGYTGGKTENPTYQDVLSKETGHLEAVQVEYDPSLVSYNDLLEVFWRTIDPTDAGGSFVDRGESYTSAIFVANDSQRKLAQASLKRLDESGRFDKKIVTPIRDAVTFYRAEDYHQDYYLTHSDDYRSYRYGSGRDQFISETWGDDAIYHVAKRKTSKNKMRKWTDKEVVDYLKPNNSELQKSLTSLQFDVTQHEGTERPFRNEFWNEKRAGIYVDIVSGEPLFSSKHKFDSGTGWPSFSQPLVANNVTEKVDRSLNSVRVEVRSLHGNSHLGHVFEDGPNPTGLRYCINSASLKFVSAKELTAEGYGHFANQFESE